MDRLPVVTVDSDQPGQVLLSHWELGDAEHYVCVDPAVVFIRPFGRADFLAEPGVPFAFLSEDLETAVDPRGQDSWRSRQEGLRSIQREVGLESPRLLSSRDCAVLSTAVLRSFRDDFLIRRHWSYPDALATVPDALGWYAMWVQKAHPRYFVAREPIVLSMTTDLQYLQESVRQASLVDLSRGYVAVAVRPPHSLHDVAPGMGEARYRVVARHASPSELLRAAWLRVYRQLPSLQRLAAVVRRNA